MTFDNSNPIAWFISLIKNIRVNLLEKFIIPGLGVSYWDFVIGLAIAAVVITVLINSVRIGLISGGGLGGNAKPKSKPSKTSNFDGVYHDGHVVSGKLPKSRSKASSSSSNLANYDGLGW